MSSQQGLSLLIRNISAILRSRKSGVFFSLQCLPAKTTTISLYIGELIQQGSSVAVLESSFYSIKWFHDLNFKNNPCSDKFVNLIPEGDRRLLSKSFRKKRAHYT